MASRGQGCPCRTRPYDARVRLASGATAISETATSLLYMKAVAGLPWMREAARAFWGGSPGDARELALSEPFLHGVAHFEARYRTVSQLVGKTRCHSILEFGAGLSFRGLDPGTPSHLPYLDTDLPAVIRQKRMLLAGLEAAHGPFDHSQYRLAPLDVLEDDALAKLAERSAGGPICLVNEGLLIYLDADAKARLCDAITSVLRRLGGEWVTGDVYVRSAAAPSPESYGEDFRRRFRIGENSFESFTAAERWFAAHGLRVIERASQAASPLQADLLLQRRGWKPATPLLQGRQTWRLALTG